jgi:hypothetical protein
MTTAEEVAKERERVLAAVRLLFMRDGVPASFMAQFEERLRRELERRAS